MRKRSVVVFWLLVAVGAVLPGLRGSVSAQDEVGAEQAAER